MRRQIGITGGSGFIGTSLARQLIGCFNVKLLDTKPPPKDLEETTAYISCDIRNAEQVAEALKDVDLVIHAAIIQIPLINEQKRLAYEVNVIGTQNVCEAIRESSGVKGMILVGTWHVIGEKELNGIVDEKFGFRPDKVEDRARLYALSKITQESIVRFYAETGEKIYGIIRMGTVLGEGMPKETAANIFIENGLANKALTPYKHSMHRPMLFVDVDDICMAYEVFAKKIINGELKKTDNSLAHIVNVYYPQPVTILDLAGIVQTSIIKCTNGQVKPQINIVDQGKPSLFNEEDKNHITVDIAKGRKLLGRKRLTNPTESIEKIVKNRLSNNF